MYKVNQFAVYETYYGLSKPTLAKNKCFHSSEQNFYMLFSYLILNEQ